MVPYYQKIMMFDPRYYYDDINKCIKNEEINEVLFLYNMNTFFLDTSFLNALNTEDKYITSDCVYLISEKIKETDLIRLYYALYQIF